MLCKVALFQRMRGSALFPETFKMGRLALQFPNILGTGWPSLKSRSQAISSPTKTSDSDSLSPSILQVGSK